MVSPADADQFRRAQLGVRRLVERDLDRMWERIWSRIPSGPTQAANVRDAFLRQLPVLVNRHGEMAATLAADWYDTQRALHGVSGAFTADVRSTPYLAQRVEGTVRRTAGALWTPRPEEMMVGLRSAVGKYVLEAGRETIAQATYRDPQARGWQRIVRPDSCDFCRMLHGRGAVYVRETAFFASHKSCNCAAVPSWDPNAPEVDVEQYRASDRMEALRRYAEYNEDAAEGLANMRIRARAFAAALG